MNSILQQQCEALAGARYPLHMPGHKGAVPPAPGLGCYAFDLTEIEGADDLHDADGILAAAMGRTAALYGSARCWYLVGRLHRGSAGRYPCRRPLRQRSHRGPQLPQGRLPCR